MDPKPVQAALPLLVGGGGERVTLRIAARYADEWNVWGDPATLRHKGGVLDRHCEDAGRDPASIARSTQALLFMSDDVAWLQRRRERSTGRPELIGTPAQLQEVVAAYRDAGVDELVVPDWTLPADRRLDTLERFLTDVAGPFR
jgi:alkanesulfonate monooxygenase SsuD/methylene tetrahydromethanopterin reductase-like flavin-dependent oxidoreductase (luciferase family)